jgi:hypothetical protein
LAGFKRPLAHVTAALRHHLLDYFVDAGQHDRRNIEVERPGGFEIESYFLLRRRLYGQIGRLLAVEDAVDVTGCAMKLIEVVNPVGDEPAGGHD